MQVGNYSMCGLTTPSNFNWWLSCSYLNGSVTSAITLKEFSFVDLVGVRCSDG